MYINLKLLGRAGYIQFFERPPRLPKWWIEVPGRRDAQGAVLEPIDLEATRKALAKARRERAEALAIVWMHAYLDPSDELRLAETARSSFDQDLHLLVRILGREALVEGDREELALRPQADLEFLAFHPARTRDGLVLRSQ